MKTTEIISNRRDFIGTGLKAAAFTGIAGISLLSACKNKADEDDDSEDKKVSPPEDLMQEHGLLNRVLLIYDNCKLHLINKQDFSLKALADSAEVIRTFVEDYHEKQEEDYLFPRFQKANQLTGLVQTLLRQHKAGRIITVQILMLTKSEKATDDEKQKLITLLNDFNTMYRPHEAREDTVLFQPSVK